jgi:hypothetical protein
MSIDGREVYVGQSIDLSVEIRDANGINFDPDSTPQVQITNCQNVVVRSFSDTDVIKDDTGKYTFTYSVGCTATAGAWKDTWRIIINTCTSDSELAFSVLDADSTVSEARDIIGDTPNIQYSQEEIYGINILMAQLSARLKNNVEVETKDAYGNIEYVDCKVFTVEELTWFLNSSLSEFNQTPHFTDYHFSDNVIYDRYAHVIVEGACILAWAAQMVMEAGREFTISDNGVTLNPPPLSSTLHNELSQFLNAHRENLKFIKGCIKPRPIGFGSFRVLASNPNYTRLRHLRERRII